MAAAATYTTVHTYRSSEGRRRRRIRVDVTGLASGANTIPHGIVQPANSAAEAPLEEQVLLTSAVVVHRTSAADATNLYYTVDSGSGTTISVYVTV